MEITKLFELLRLLEGVKSYRWEMVMSLVELLKTNNSVSIIKKEWAPSQHKQSYPDLYPLNLADIKTWTTQESNGIDIRFKNESGKLHCVAKIYDCDMRGRREDLRFTSEFILPADFIKKIENLIKAEFDDYLDKEYEKHLQKQKENWIAAKKYEILNAEEFISK